ncbi:glycosyltransferase family 39 protein [bacterium]|nr:glycosyltransferase family 39 protein [bacterium]
MHILLLFCPLSSFCALLLSGSYEHTDQKGLFLHFDRLTVIDAMVLWASFMWLITEGLSLINGLTRVGVALAWLLITIVVFLFPAQRQKLYLLPTLFKSLKSRCCRWSTLVMVIIPLVLLLIALWAPPNNWDAMNYHMARVEHWIQNANVKHYPCHIAKQLFLNPGAEYCMCHLQILSGGDRFANMVQWSSLIGCMIIVSLLAQFLGCNRSGQLLGTVFVTTLPMAILQASSAQNDLVAAFFLAAFFLYAFHFLDSPVPRNAILLGLSLGLAILTKATAYTYALPLLAFIALTVLLRTHRKNSFKLLTMAACLVVIINFGHYTRNYLLYNHPLAPTQYRGLNINQSMSPTIFCSNLIRNVSLHLGTPNHEWNDRLANMILQCHERLDLDITDPRTTYGTVLFSLFFSNHEDTAGNPLHFALIVVSLLIVFLGYTSQKRSICIFFGILVLSFVLFCTVIKWNPWNSRYQLPLFILAAPAVAAALTRFDQTWLYRSVLGLMLCCALPWIIWNHARPLYPLPEIMRSTFSLSSLFQDRATIFTVPRRDQYFVSFPEIRQPCIQTMQLLGRYRCNSIGLIGHEGVWEYPFWVLAREFSPGRTSFSHLNVPEGPYSGYNFKAVPQVCALIQMTAERLELQSVEEQIFRKIWSTGPFDLMTPLPITSSSSTAQSK